MPRNIRSNILVGCLGKIEDMEEEKPKPTKTKTDDKKEDSKEIDESELVFSDVGFVILLE